MVGIKKIKPAVLWAAALAVAGVALLYCESPLLWKLQEQNLFLFTSHFFREQMVVPGGLLSWASTFFTQFFYYPWLGTLWLCAWWLLLMWLLKRAFRIPDQWAALTIVPVGLLLLTIVTKGYFIYVLKLPGHAFVPTIGATAVAALLWAFRSLPGSYGLRTLFVAVTCLAAYPLMGIYGLAAPLLMAVLSWRMKDKAVVNTIVAVVGVVAVPLLCYRFIYYQTNLANIYYAALPMFYVTEEYHAYYTPYYLLALSFLLAAVVPLPQAKPKKAVVVQAVAVAAVVAGVALFWFKDENFHRELKMMRSVEQCDWPGVLTEAAKQEDEPTRAIVMMRNLALARLGRQGDDQFLYLNGSKKYAAPFGMRLMLAVGPTIYYHYGMLNYCGRLSTEMGVEFGWRAENLKLLAKCALLNGEQQHARKYLGLLRKTLFFSGWADTALKLVGDSAAIAKDGEMGAVTHMLHYSNSLNSDQGNIERFLMLQLAYSKYTGDPVFQEQTLLAALWTRDLRLFWQHFSDYLQLHPKAAVPRSYQEAAYLYGKLEGRKNLDHLPFDESVKQSFENFMQAAERYDNAEVEVAREGLKFFNHTYYYDYYLMSQLPEY